MKSGGIPRLSLLLPTVVGCGVLLVACATETPEPETAAETDQAIKIRTLSEAEVIRGAGANGSPRMIADLLFAALQALDADRLLTPINDNAHDRFQRVLSFDPDNAIALEGLEDIVLRYVELAQDASRQGLFEEAETLLGRARYVNPAHPAIAETGELLQAEKDSGDLFFELNASQLAQRSEAIQQEIAAIAEQARENEAFFLITAPSDDLARWIFSVMREAVSGYRLRGNIELASRSGVRLRLPKAEN